MPHSLNPQCPACCIVWLLRVLHASKSDSSVSFMSQSLTPQCPACHIVQLLSVLHAIKSDSSVSCMPHSLTPQCPACHIVQLLSITHATKSDSLLSHMPHSRKKECECFIWYHTVQATDPVDQRHWLTGDNFYFYTVCLLYTLEFVNMCVRTTCQEQNLSQLLVFYIDTIKLYIFFQKLK